MGTTNYDFTYLEPDNKIDLVGDTTTFLDEIDLAISDTAQTFDTVSDMKAGANLKVGMTCHTNGFYSKGDAGSAWYAITDDATPNEMDVIECDNGLYAVMILTEKNIRPEKLGAHSNLIDDDTAFLQRAIDYAISKRIAVLAEGRYLTTAPLSLETRATIIGGYTNDEYESTSLIKNTVTDIFTISESKTGVQIKNLCFDKGDPENNGCFINTTYTLKWWEMESCGFQNFGKVFDAPILGCRFFKFWINHSYTVGRFDGTDCTFSDWFIGSFPTSTNRKNALHLDGMNQSRFYNLYFTGGLPTVSGACSNIVYIGGYSANLDFIGCWFDYSMECAIKVQGKANDFPRSGAQGINFYGCYIRGNCHDQSKVTNVIDLSYCKGVTVRDCFFDTNDSYLPNPQSKTYHVHDYALNVRLDNNSYVDTRTNTNGDWWIYVEDFDLHGIKARNMGFSGGQGTNDYVINVQNSRIEAKQVTVTTGSTYGEATVNFTGFDVTPIYNVCAVGNYIVTINTATKSNVQVIVRRAYDNSLVLGQSITLNAIAMGTV